MDLQSWVLFYLSRLVCFVNPGVPSRPLSARPECRSNLHVQTGRAVVTQAQFNGRSTNAYSRLRIVLYRSVPPPYLFMAFVRPALNHTSGTVSRPLVLLSPSPLRAITSTLQFRSSPVQATSSHRPFHTTPTFRNMQQGTKNLLEEIKVRRSTYTLSPESTLSVDEIKTILETTLEEAPSTFGSFTTRLVLVVQEEHKKLWATVTEIMKAVTPEGQWEGHTKPRLDGFANAYGTILL